MRSGEVLRRMRAVFRPRAIGINLVMKGFDSMHSSSYPADRQRTEAVWGHTPPANDSIVCPVFGCIIRVLANQHTEQRWLCAS